MKSTVSDGRILDAKAKATDKDESLKRLGGGRWQTRDDRFTIEPQSGTWVVVDAEQTDELGLQLVRGPFGSLGAAKEAIATARGTKPAASPLAARVAKSAKAGRPPAKPTKPDVPSEPRWMRDLEPADRRRANRLIDRLTDAGASDPEGIVRRDIVGAVPAVAAFAIARALSTLGNDATPAEVTRLLTGGRDEDLGVRWRLVDADDRPITVDFDAVEPG